MFNEARAIGVRRRPGLAPMAAVIVLGLALAACGGDNGGDGGGPALMLRVAVANETDSEATMQINDGEAQTLESCKGSVFTFELPDSDWVLNVNGQPAIDSLELESRLIGRNLTAQVWINEDGTLETRHLTAGSNIQAPAALSICT